MAGRSLKGAAISKIYSTASDIDTLIVSEHLFTYYVMKSLSWVKDLTIPNYGGIKPVTPPIESKDAKHIGWLASHAYKGIWRPDSLPPNSEARIEFFEKFSDVSLKTLGLQLSDDTVAKVNGRIARSFDDAAHDLATSIARLRKEFRGEPVEPEVIVAQEPETSIVSPAATAGTGEA